jgi:hypothetical protein
MCEVFNQNDRCPQLALFAGIFDPIPIFIGYIENILRAITDGPDYHAGNIGACKSQSIGKFVKKTECIRGIDTQDRIRLEGSLMISMSMGAGEQPFRNRLKCRSYSFCQRSSCFSAKAGLKHVQHSVKIITVVVPNR